MLQGLQSPVPVREPAIRVAPVRAVRGRVSQRRTSVDYLDAFECMYALCGLADLTDPVRRVF